MCVSAGQFVCMNVNEGLGLHSMGEVKGHTEGISPGKRVKGCARRCRMWREKQYVLHGTPIWGHVWDHVWNKAKLAGEAQERMHCPRPFITTDGVPKKEARGSMTW